MILSLGIPSTRLMKIYRKISDNQFKIDKKYYSTSATLEQLDSELWQFVSLCGKYSGFYTNESPNHKNQFKYFLNNIEKLQMRYIEEQYVKVSDESHMNKNNEITFVPPSIYKNQLATEQQNVIINTTKE